MRYQEALFSLLRSCKAIPAIILFSLILAGCSPNQQATADQVNQTESRSSKYNSLEKTRTDTEDLFPVYGYDRSCINKEVNFWIKVPRNLTLEGKLEFLADKLTRFKFKNLPITIQEIKSDNGKKVAVINLEENEFNKGIKDPEKVSGSPADTWIFGYFQGSAGGSSTTETLCETFLQRQYDNVWIDAVEFLYENKPIKEYDHVGGLAQRIYR